MKKTFEVINHNPIRFYMVVDCCGLEHYLCSLGWESVDYEDSTVVVFSGGSDIDPAIYGAKNEGSHPSNLDRDRKEVEYYIKARMDGKFMIGVCRGHQLLFALMGGGLIQHIDDHEGGGHPINLYTKAGSYYGQITSSSAHHQAVSWFNRFETRKIYVNNKVLTGTIGSLKYNVRLLASSLDNKVIEGYCAEHPLNGRVNMLCVQGHPEFGPTEFSLWFKVMAEKLVSFWTKMLHQGGEIAEYGTILMPYVPLRFAPEWYDKRLLLEGLPKRKKNPVEQNQFNTNIPGINHTTASILPPQVMGVGINGDFVEAV